MTGHKDADRRARDVWRPRSGGDSRGLFGDSEEQHDVDEGELTARVEEKQRKYSGLMDREAASALAFGELAGEEGDRTADEITRSVWDRGERDRGSVGDSLEDAGRGLFESAGLGRTVDFDRQRPNGRFAPEGTGPDPQRGVDRAPDGRYVSPDRTRPRVKRDDDGRFTSDDSRWSL